MLGVEELDEALEEIWALLHLTLSSFDKVLAKDRTRSVTGSSVSWILETGFDSYPRANPLSHD